MQCMHSKDLASIEIQLDLLTAPDQGQTQLMEFIERLLPQEERQVKFHDPLSKNKPKTFQTLYDLPRNAHGKQAVSHLKVDRRVLQGLSTAYDAQRNVDLDSLLCHELLPVPISMANMDGTLRSASKAVFIEELQAGITCPTYVEQLELGPSPTLVIDGMALVISLGKPTGVATFGDFASHFLRHTLHNGSNFRRIDVLFDRYNDVSIQSGTRSKKQAKPCPSDDQLNQGCPIPDQYESFLSTPR